MGEGILQVSNPYAGYVTSPALRRPQAEVPAGAGKYHGAVSENYDAKRENTPKHILEQAIIERLLSVLPAGSTVLDIPVGTGRFLNFYVSRGFRFIGADLSGDQLAKAALKVTDREQVNGWVQQSNAAGKIITATIDEKGVLAQGDVRQIGLEAKSVDASVMCRLTRWLSPADCQVAMKELQRVTRSRIIWTARVANHAHARTIELFEQALDGWKITHNEAGVDIDYRILMAEPC